MTPVQQATVAYGLFRVAWVLLALGIGWWLWRRAKGPAAATAAVIGLHLIAWLAYTWPFERLYGLQPFLDRAFNVGNAACAAAGASPLEHVQAGHTNVEPFWSAVLAAVALYRPENVLVVYHWFAPACLLLVGLGLAYGLRQTADDDDAWECVVIAWAVLALSSISLTHASNLPPFWAGTFFHKPNHATSFALVALAIGGFARGWPALVLAGILGLLGWVFILTWGYLAAGLVLAAALWSWPGLRRRTAIALAVSALVIAPYVAFLARDHAPHDAGATPAQVWQDETGSVLALPNWLTLDLAPLAFAAAFGIAVARRRDRPRDRLLLGLAAGTAAGWLGYAAGALVGFAPEPDEFHYWGRFVISLLAGVGLFELARTLAEKRGLALGQGALAVMAVSLPLSFPAWWDPPVMDRYYRLSVPPIPTSVLDYTRWVRENTPEGTVFLATGDPSSWIPTLAGRQVLLAMDARPPSDYAERRQVQKVLMTSADPAEIAETARRWRIGYVAVDLTRRNDIGHLAVHPAYESVFANDDVHVLRVRGAEPR